MKSPSTALVPGFFEQFRSHPDRPAFGFSDKVYTYGEVMDIVQGILHAMSNPSFAAEHIVAVLATPDVHTYAAILAILASGRAYVPIHPQQPPERNWSCLEQAGTHVMLQSGAGSELQRWLGDGRLSLSSGLWRNTDGTLPRSARSSVTSASVVPGAARPRRREVVRSR